MTPTHNLHPASLHLDESSTIRSSIALPNSTPRHLHNHALHPALPPTSSKPTPQVSNSSTATDSLLQSVLHIIPLRTAAEFITFTLAINKITGFYGILALLTGFHLNPLQFSHYLYSIVVLGLALWLSPSIRGAAGSERDTLKCMGLAWLHVVDAVVNGVYTSLFGLGWFVVLAQHLGDGSVGVGVPAPGGATINDTAGFTSPSHTVSAVTIVATPAAGLLAGQEAVAFAAPAVAGGSLGAVIFDESSLASITVLALLWLLRLYFCVVMLSFARSTLRRYIASTSTTSYSTDATMADNPFSSRSGVGSSLGRAMLKFPTKRYWLGKDESGIDEEWVRATSDRFESGRSRSGRAGLKVSVPATPAEAPGVGERERRARSGTGPPQHLAVGTGAAQSPATSGKAMQ